MSACIGEFYGFREWQKNLEDSFRRTVVHGSNKRRVPGTVVYSCESTIID
jgi:hypothetical protein